jgi:hypothetical protein
MTYCKKIVELIKVQNFHLKHKTIYLKINEMQWN